MEVWGLRNCRFATTNLTLDRKKANARALDLAPIEDPALSLARELQIVPCSFPEALQEEHCSVLSPLRYTLERCCDSFAVVVSGGNSEEMH